MKSKAIATLALILTLAGCAPVEGDATQPHSDHNYPEIVWPHTVTLPDGRHVLCVFEKSGYGGGVSCDWVNAK